ncbi:MAG: translation initiation factor IF-2 [Desulfobulbaceae bacterium]|nr:translation initiation factor IF-2 [Desulfobulbaceae bacterium]
MTKVRVYALAKEAGMDGKELAERLIEMGYDVKSHSSSVDEDVAAEIRVKLGLVETTTERKRIQGEGRTTIIRRRTKHVPSEALDVEILDDTDTDDEEDGDLAALEKSTEVVLETPLAPEFAVEPIDNTEPDEVPLATAIPPETTPVESAPEIDREEVAVIEPPVRSDAAIPEAPVASAVPEPSIRVIDVRKRAGFATVIKKAAIVIPQPEPKARPKRVERVEKVENKGGRPAPVVAERGAPKGGVSAAPAADNRSADAKGKKGKRYVKFSPEPVARERVKKVGKGKGHGEVDMEEVDAFGGRLSANLRVGRSRHGGGKKSKHHGAEPAAETKAIKKRIKIMESISIGDLAHRMGVKVNEIIANLIKLGVMATVNQALDVETATLVASDFGYEVEQGLTDEQTVINLEESYTGGEVLPRPPVVTVMGHVDHGKTSILDAIRKTDVAAGEAGGITQHIGAHYVRSTKGDVVFLDTPGHEAFTEMRSRGAKVTDIVVLVVAADDGVMDQTREAINHARAAEVPIVVAINKIDKPGANIDRVKAELAEFSLTPEEWGGQTIFCETSAKKGTGIEELLEQILLQAEILELKADHLRPAKGWVVEAQLHKGLGAVATILVQHGTLKVGDAFLVGDHYGRVRSMHDDKGIIIEKAGPAVPVEVHGLSGVPRAGDEFVVVKDEKLARSLSNQRQIKQREAALATGTKISLDNLFEHLKAGVAKELRLVLRTDVQGTLEAFSSAIEKLSTDAVKVKIIHQGTGAIIESDVLLASASQAMIFGFNVRPSAKSKELAKNEGVDIRLYDVIYHALDDIRKAMVGLLEPTFEENVIGTVEVRDIFHHPKAGTIAGSYVTDGKVERNARVRVVRDNVVIYTGKISSLRRFKDDVKDVQTGFEFGLSIENYNDLKVGDIIEAFVLKEVAGEL